VPEICTLHIIIINMCLCPSLCQHPTLVTAGNSVPLKPILVSPPDIYVIPGFITFSQQSTILLYRPDGSSPDTPSL